MSATATKLFPASFTVALVAGVFVLSANTWPASVASDCSGTSIWKSATFSGKSPEFRPRSFVTWSSASRSNAPAGVPGKLYAPSGPLVMVRRGVSPSAKLMVTWAPGTKPLR